jgi:hypothetical protein
VYVIKLAGGYVGLAPGEAVTVRGESSTLQFVAPHAGQTVDIELPAGKLQLSSALGHAFEWNRETHGLLNFVVLEPSPSVWRCENDRGDPPHPVSPGDTECRVCGGKVARKMMPRY